VELVRRLLMQIWGEALPLGELPAPSQHVRGEVGAVDVEPGLEERDQHAAGPARHVERRLPGLDEGAEELDLRPALVELAHHFATRPSCRV
jgi:hypothetical protein